jgi:hypothetical protein
MHQITPRLCLRVESLHPVLECVPDTTRRCYVEQTRSYFAPQHECIPAYYILTTKSLKTVQQSLTGFV